MADEIRWEEGMLEELARAMTYPPARDLRQGVLLRIAAPAPPGPRTGAWRYAFAGLAVLVAAFLFTVLISRDVREAVADFLGLAVEGERIETLPTPAGGTTATPFPTPVRFDQIAERTTRTEAVKAAGLEPVLPSSLGEPIAFYLLSIDGRAVLIADYGPMQIWEFRNDGSIFIGKGIPVGGGTTVAQVTVNGQPGYWISGGQRLVTVNGPDGTPRAGTQRTVLSEALIWSDGGIYRRIEGVSNRAEALSLAAQMP